MPYKIIPRYGLRAYYTCIAVDRIPLKVVSRAVQTKEGASTCARAKFGDISAVALFWDPKPSAGELSTRSPPSAALKQLAAACLCCYGDVPRALVFFYVNTTQRPYLGNVFVGIFSKCTITSREVRPSSTNETRGL